MTRNRSPRIREVQCKLLVSSSSTNEGIVNTTEEHIRGLVGGRVPHRYAALSVGFAMAIGAGRENTSSETTTTTQPEGTTLQCSGPGCSRANVPLFLRDVGEGLTCNACWSRLICLGCGRPRKKKNRISCGGCRKTWN